MIWIYLLFALSQVCRAIHDTVWDHWEACVFNSSRFKEYWWNPDISWENKYIMGRPDKGTRQLFWSVDYPVQLTDARHFFKFWEIAFNWGAVVVALYLRPEAGNILLFIIFSFIAYNLVFSLFYDWLLIKGKTLRNYLQNK